MAVGVDGEGKAENECKLLPWLLSKVASVDVVHVSFYRPRQYPPRNTHWTEHVLIKTPFYHCTLYFCYLLEWFDLIVFDRCYFYLDVGSVQSVSDLDR